VLDKACVYSYFVKLLVMLGFLQPPFSLDSSVITVTGLVSS